MIERKRMRRITRLEQYFQERDVDVEQLAQHIGRSSSYLRGVFNGNETLTDGTRWRSLTRYPDLPEELLYDNSRILVEPEIMTPYNACQRVRRAIRAGELTRPDACELCGANHHKPHAHHWNGYDDPINVWFICGRCNRILRGKHDGSLTKDQARALVRR